MSVAEDGFASAPDGGAAGLLQRLDIMRTAFLRDGPRDNVTRIENLERLQATLLARREEIAEVISADFGTRARVETLIAEVFVVASAIRHARRNLRSWTRRRWRSVGLELMPARAWVVPQALGVVGIIAPWNYPLNLALSPLVAAIAAGNRVMLKPSELTPRTGELLQSLLAEVFAEDEVLVVNGGPEVAAQFAALPFDHLLFTGSTAVGRKVMAAAAANLTPVTLELGGKSPALIGPDADLERATDSIVHGKLFNAGQTCIAPDYVLVPEDRLEAFCYRAEATARRLYPRLAGNADYTSIVNDRHAARLAELVDDAAARGARIRRAHGADAGGNERKLPLTLVLDADPAMKVMQEEIFGPVLPVLGYRELDEAIGHVNRHDRPLALYLFERDQATIDRVLERTWSGGVSINETLLHAGVEDLPFGGIGPSGMGQYHGREGFETFSKLKPVFAQGRLNGSRLLRPPYGRLMELVMKLLLRG
ncbi:MAG TPA: coniferyl aldehyde dehydrogenase [Alphaproteobacteria bacterium]|nr:coniferyl aldehyde dehydrogenase [Alphaproteobacteria bacterium]